MRRLLPRLRPIVLAATVATSVAALTPLAAAATEVTVERVWTYAHKQVADGPKAEIVAYDDATDTLWIAGVTGVDVLSRVSGQRVAHIAVGQFGAVNSVAVKNGLAALAIESTPDRTVPGVVVFYDTATRLQSGPAVAVGALPDMLTFTPDGSRVLVANEGTPNQRPTPAGLSSTDPVGSVSVIDVASRAVVTVPITPEIPGYGSLRLFEGALAGYDPEPEYIAVDRTGRTAYVGLQEANGIAVLNLRSLKFERIFSLGLKDFSLPGNELDATDRDGGGSGTGIIKLQSGLPLFGLYQPDTIATYAYRGRTYLVMANEGDSRDNGSGDSEDEVRASLYSSDPRYARATLSSIDSSADKLVMFGGRSISIRDAAGKIVYESGSLLDREAIRLGLVPGADPQSIANTLYDDGRSDNKGMEPEGLALLKVKGRVLAFVGLERGKGQASGVNSKSAFAVFDVTDPHAVQYIDMIVSDGDASPEGLVAFAVGGRTFVAVANEVSDTTSLFEVAVRRERGADR